MQDIITYSLCGISGLILILSFFLKNSNFFDVRSIFVQHIKVFKGNLLQMYAFFIAPIFFSLGIVRIRCVDREVLNNINVVLSILLAMFFAFLSILCAIDGSSKKKEYEQLLKETFNAIVFEMLLCLFLLFVSFIALFIGIFEKIFLLKVTSGVIYYLSIVVILNMLVVIKRIKVLFEEK